uniref:FLYWCH-type domain-containing protein n=1 Tax=Panagrolaimus sp. PS1159 TaxID=55785 RepID=A0AC35FQV5_9BILA
MVTPSELSNDAKYEKEFDEMVNARNEYCKKSKEDMMKMKSKILPHFKQYRPVKMENFTYGISTSLKENHRIIIYESNDKSKVREYYLHSKRYWYCTDCSAKRLLNFDGIILISRIHRCKKRNAKEVMKKQAEYQTKKNASNSLSSYGLNNSELETSQMNLSIPSSNNSQRKATRIRGTKTTAALRISKLATEEQNFVAEENVEINLPPLMQTNCESIFSSLMSSSSQLLHTPNATSTSRLQQIENQSESIFANLIEYTSHPSENFDASTKSNILTTLRTHRPLKYSEWEFGLSKKLKENCRLIAFEFNDKTKVREYAKNSDSWFCVRHGLKCSAPSAKFINGIVFVPINHTCAANQHSTVMLNQQKLKSQKNISFAASASANISVQKRTMNSAVETALNNSINQNNVESFGSSVKVGKPGVVASSLATQNVEIPLQIETPPPTLERMDLNTSEVPKTSKRKIPENGGQSLSKRVKMESSAGTTATNVKPIRIPPSTPTLQTEIQAKNNTLKTVEEKDEDEIEIIEEKIHTPQTVEEIDEDEVEIIEEKIHKSSVAETKPNKMKDDEPSMAIDFKPEIDQMNISETEFSFITPSSTQLKNICQMFGLFYDNSALKGIWHKIEFSTFKKSSNKIVTYEYKTKNIFELFSILLTDSPLNYAPIQDKINQDLQDELRKSGEIPEMDFGTIPMSKTLKFVAKSLKIKIAVFGKSEFYQFGKTEDDELLTFVFYLNDGFYSIVLDL